MATRADPQVHVGPGQAELDEENLGHPFVVVLPGVHDPLIVTERRQGADHRRGLHEVRPCPEHVRDGCAHRNLSVHPDPLPSPAVTTSPPRRSPSRPRAALDLAARPAPRGSQNTRRSTRPPTRAPPPNPPRQPGAPAPPPPPPQGQSMIMASSGQIAPVSGHDHETPSGGHT